MKLASCVRLAIKTQRQTNPLVSEQLDLDTMNVTNLKRKGLASLSDKFTDITSSGQATLDGQVSCSTLLIPGTTLLLRKPRDGY